MLGAGESLDGGVPRFFDGNALPLPEASENQILLLLFHLPHSGVVPQPLLVRVHY